MKTITPAQAIVYAFGLGFIACWVFVTNIMWATGQGWEILAWIDKL